MVWNLIEYATTFIESWIYANFMIRFLQVKNRKHMFLTYFMIVLTNFIITTSLNNLMLYEGLLGFIRILFNFVYAILLFKGNIFEKLFSSFITDTSILLINYLTLNVLCILFSMDMTGLVTDRGIFRITYIFITKFLFFLFTRILIKIKQHEHYTFSKIEWITLSAVFIITMSVEIEIFQLALMYDMSSQNPTAICAGVGLIAVNILVYIIMRQISKKNEENIALLMDKMQLEVYKSHLTDSEKQHEEIQQIRHDMKNHLQYISGLIQEQATDEAQNYIEDMLKNKLNFGYAHIKTGCKVVDIIANSKLSECSAKSIRIVTSTSHFELDMEDIDVCVVLGNLFDNAMEACCKVANERFLYFEMVQNKGYVHLVIKNSIEAPVLETNPELVTTKRDKKTHGIGLKSVKSVVKKYDGMMSFYEEHDMFVIDVWLPARKTE